MIYTAEGIAAALFTTLQTVAGLKYSSRVLKAIGASNHVVGAASIIQIILITAIGVGLGGFFTYLLSLSFPPTVPIVFNGQRTLISIVALLLTGPVGGYVSIRYATRIEPLKALGLSQ